MNKEQFLNQLSEKLATLEQLERVRMVQYYSEIIEDRVEDGLSEEEAVAELEDLDTIAARILDELAPAQVERPIYYQEPSRKKRSAWTIALLVLGSPIWISLLAAAGVVILSMYIVVWALVISLFAVVVSLGIAGIAGVVGLIFHIGAHAMTGLFLLGAGFVCAAIGVALFFPVCQFAKFLIAGTARAGRAAWNAIFRRKKGAQ